MLRRGRFLTGAYNEELGVKDVTWLTPTGDEMTPEHWHDPNGRCLGVLLDGRAQQTGIRRRGNDATLLLVFNAHHDVVPFTLPGWWAAPAGTLMDTNQPDSTSRSFYPFGQDYAVTGRSLLLFELKPERTPQRATAAERSFQRVVQAVEEAALKAVRFGFE